ncbi:MAG: glutamate--tRNA ligase [Actinomycetota bacterium]
MTVRTRLAPAPSGAIHVGNARTGLFSWAYARHHGGSFVLRVEDTDTSRVSEEAYHGLVESLRWLGMDWDEGPDVGGPHAPYRQSQRLDVYRGVTERLLDQGNAYRCYCTAEELEERRTAALAAGQPPGYDGRCRDLGPAARAAHEAAGRPAAIRFAMPDEESVVTDLVKGEVRWAPGALGDFVINSSDGSPTFLLAVAVDDLLMEITHVVRGDDLLASAPRNAALIGALGGTPPTYAHVPQVNGTDGKPLSKRHGSTSLEAFREQGFLPEALMNYLVLLGWSKDAETTFLSRDEFVEAFDLDRVSSNPAAFDVQKLEWMNNHYVQSLGDDDLAARSLRFLAAAGLSPEPAELSRAMPLVRERMKRLTEVVELLRFLFSDDVAPNEKAAALIAGAGEGFLRAAVAGLEAVDPWESAGIGAALDALAEGAGLSRTKGWQPVRAAVTGSNVSPPLPESLELLGRERTLERLRAAIA